MVGQKRLPTRVIGKVMEVDVLLSKGTTLGVACKKNDASDCTSGQSGICVYTL